MKIIKWKLSVKNIDNIQKLLIITLNQNNLINIVKEETEIFFYTLINQKKILLQIDDNYFDLILNDLKKYEYSYSGKTRAILFYDKVGVYKYNRQKQNKIDDRFIYSRGYNSLVPEYLNKTSIIFIRDILNNKEYGNDSLSSLITYIFAFYIKSNLSSMLVKPFIENYNINESKYKKREPTYRKLYIEPYYNC